MMLCLAFICGCTTIPLTNAVVVKKIHNEAWDQVVLENHGGVIINAHYYHPDEYYVIVSGGNEDGKIETRTYTVSDAQYKLAVVGKSWTEQ